VLYASDKQKNYPTAVEYGDKLFAATDTVKYTASDYTYYADALLNVGRIDDAITAYKHIPEVDPENKEVNKLISDAYLKAKKILTT
jgi:tetratricopeptide (TPR) repeat protein